MTLILGHGGLRKQETFVSIISESFLLIYLEFSVPLWLVGLNTVIRSLSQLNNMRENPMVVNLWGEKSFTIKDLWTNFFFKLGMMIKTSWFYIFIPVWIALTFIQVHKCMRKQTCLHSFIPFFFFLLYAVVTCHFVEAPAKSSLHNQYSSEREPYLSDFCLNTSSTLAYVQMLMNQFLSSFIWWQTPLNSKNWYQFEWPWSFLKVSGLRESWKQCNHFCCKVA